MDQYDALLRKAREEIVEQPESHDSVFNSVWADLEKGMFDGMRRGYQETRRPIGQAKRSLVTDKSKGIYRDLMQQAPPPKPARVPRAPRAPRPAPADDPVEDPVEAGLAEMRVEEEELPMVEPFYGLTEDEERQERINAGPQEPSPRQQRINAGPMGGPRPPPLPSGTAPGYVKNTEGLPPSFLNPTGMNRKTLVPEGMEDQYPNMKPNQRAMDAGLSEMQQQDTPPSMRQTSPEESQNIRDSGQETGIVPYGHSFNQERGLQTTGKDSAVEAGMKQLTGGRQRELGYNPEYDMKRPIVPMGQDPAPDKAWEPELGESGTWGGSKEHFNPKTQKLYGNRSGGYKAFMETQNQKESDTTITDAKARQEKREKDRATGDRPGTQTTLFDETPPKPNETGLLEGLIGEKKKTGINMPGLVGNETPTKDTKKSFENANLSLLPASMISHINGDLQKADDADYSLLPHGWREGAAQ